MDNYTRRAFALDSRTVWVEQALINDEGFIIPIDNLPLGPGEYSPKILERHISTPSIGGFRGVSDHFKPFKSNLTIRTPLDDKNLSSSSYNSFTKSTSSKISQQLGEKVRTEFTTIFHEHDSRQGIDPNNRFCDTPGPYLKHDSMLKTINNDGIKKPINLNFGPDNIPFGELHHKTIKAGPSYDIQYDSEQLKPKTKYGKFLKAPRPKDKTKNYDDEIQIELDNTISIITNDLSTIKISTKHIKQNNDDDSELSIRDKSYSNTAKAKLVKLPKLKTKKLPDLTLIDNSYQNNRIKVHDLTPSFIKKEAKINLFEKIETIPRKHLSQKFVTKSSQKVIDKEDDDSDN